MSSQVKVLVSLARSLASTTQVRIRADRRYQWGCIWAKEMLFRRRFGFIFRYFGIVEEPFTDSYIAEWKKRMDGLRRLESPDYLYAEQYDRCEQILAACELARQSGVAYITLSIRDARMIDWRENYGESLTEACSVS